MGLVIVERKSPLLKFNPVQIFRRYTVYFHCYTIINGANKLAEIAADTFLFFYRVCVIRFAIVQVDGLV
jgi:hypothetical protein